MHAAGLDVDEREAHKGKAGERMKERATYRSLTSLKKSDRTPGSTARDEGVSMGSLQPAGLCPNVVATLQYSADGILFSRSKSLATFSNVLDSSLKSTYHYYY